MKPLFEKITPNVNEMNEEQLREHVTSTQRATGNGYEILESGIYIWPKQAIKGFLAATVSGAIGAGVALWATSNNPTEETNDTFDAATPQAPEIIEVTAPRENVLDTFSI